MKKKELLAAIPKELPKQNTARLINTSEGKALMVILPEDIFLIDYRDVHGCVHFTWKNGYLTYYMEIGMWVRRAFRNIDANAYLKSSGFDEKSQEAFESFTGIDANVGYGIRNYEDSIDYKKWEHRMDNRQARINKWAAEAPALPKGFLQWCEKQIPQELGNRQRHLHRKEYIQLFQKCRTGCYVERMFRVEYDITKEKHWHRTTELVRGFSRIPIGSWDRWYYGVIDGASGKEQRWWDRKGGTQVNNCPQKMILYSKNLNELGLPTHVVETLKAMHMRMDYGTLAVATEENPELEKLAKGGLQQLVCDICMNSFTREQNWKIVRKLTKSQLQKIAEIDGGIYEAEMLEMHPEITEKSLQILQTFRGVERRNAIQEVSEGLNINHVLTLLKKTGSYNLDSLREYRDYIRMAGARGMQINDEIVYRNKRWRYFHAKYVEEEERNADAELNRENDNISADYRENCENFQAETDGYLFLVPRNASDIRAEGRLQHHCVGRAGYIEKMNRRESFIIFLRKAEEPQVPYYTIETDGYRIIQAYGAYDRKPDWDTVNKLLQAWIKEVRKRKMQRETQRIAI